MAVTEWGNKTKIDEKYYECWQPLKKHFNESNAEGEIVLQLQEKKMHLKMSSAEVLCCK